MRIYFAFLISLLLGCASPDKFPEGMVCSAIWNKDAKNSYFYCRVKKLPEEFQRIPVEEYMGTAPVCVSPDHYAEIMEWKRDLEGYVSRGCRY